jgi:NO-binding membrane sensor protein with MHYT domain
VTTRRYAALAAASVLVGSGSCLLLLWRAADEPWLFSRRGPADFPGGYAVMAVAAVAFTGLTAATVILRLSPSGPAGTRADDRPVAFAATLAYRAFLSTLMWFITFRR